MSGEGEERERRERVREGEGKEGRRRREGKKDQFPILGMTQFCVSAYPAHVGGNAGLTQQPCTQAFKELEEVLVIKHSRGDMFTHPADGPGDTVSHLN